MMNKENLADTIFNKAVEIIKSYNVNSYKHEIYEDFTELNITVYNDDMTIDEVETMIAVFENMIAKVENLKPKTDTYKESVFIEGDTISIRIDIEEVV